MSNENKGYTLKEIALALVPLLGLLFVAHNSGFSKGTESYKGSLKQAELLINTLQEDLKKKSAENDKLKDYLRIGQEGTKDGTLAKDKPKDMSTLKKELTLTN